MCGRARCVLSADDISTSSKIPKKRFLNFEKYEPKENMTPGSCFPVVYVDQRSGERVLQVMTWGLVPSFTSSKIEKPDFFKMFNARIETIDEKPSFQKIAQTKRCVVLLSGYFEWKTSSDTGRKQPYYVSRQDNQAIMLAGVYDTWKGENELLYTFSIITAPAEVSIKEGIQNLHSRQPVFLCSSSAVDRWLEGAKHEDIDNDNDIDYSVSKETGSLLDPTKAPDDLVIYPVTPLMSHASYQHEDCARRIASPLKSKRMTDFFKKSPHKEIQTKEEDTTIRPSKLADISETPVSPEKKTVPDSSTNSLLKMLGSTGKAAVKKGKSTPDKSAIKSPSKGSGGKKRGCHNITEYFTSGSNKKKNKGEDFEFVRDKNTLTEEDQVRLAIKASLSDIPPCDIE